MSCLLSHLVTGWVLCYFSSICYSKWAFHWFRALDLIGWSNFLLLVFYFYPPENLGKIGSFPTEEGSAPPLFIAVSLASPVSLPRRVIFYCFICFKNRINHLTFLRFSGSNDPSWASKFLLPRRLLSLNLSSNKDLLEVNTDVYKTRLFANLTKVIQQKLRSWNSKFHPL